MLLSHLLCSRGVVAVFSRTNSLIIYILEILEHSSGSAKSTVDKILWVKDSAELSRMTLRIT